ncbi:DUF4760 domain-containing protein [Parvularcula sp. LCG005]|uniref:DUF4760 domain-containing protein n=1 Tax=Parvularcula sp. LCG005 TaxID=3078805 RepID=UPI00294375B8|nr:DUF4760 domain-containing protein [Parvularcula sp. LCG005]WOI52097.1 DUF4760 domain-containing protein [Parvularcula sp. LCG005]
MFGGIKKFRSAAWIIPFGVLSALISVCLVLLPIFLSAAILLCEVLPTSQTLRQCSTAVFDQSTVLALTAYATFASAIAICVTFAIGLRHQAKMIPKSAAMMEVNSQTRDTRLVELFRAFGQLHDRLEKDGLTFNEASITENESHGNNFSVDDRAVIVGLLNYYEAWAVGVQSGAYDEYILKQWWRTAYVRHWILLREYVNGHRLSRPNPAAYKEYELLAKRWATDDEQRMM